MSQIITTHDANGKAIFSSKLPEQQHSFPIPLGNMTMLYTSHSFPPNVNSDQDMDQYAIDREKGIGPGVACPPGGTGVSIISMAPGLKTPLRRLPALGVFYVLEGQVILHLDSGESKMVKAGDVGVIRGAMHSWTNDTPNEGWARLLSVSQSIEPLEISGKSLPPGAG